jgi:hypothetical protein
MRRNGMEFDITWKNVSEAQAAALEHVTKHARKWLDSQKMFPGGLEGEFVSPLTEFDLAEMMCMGKNSFWYSQARSWAEGGTVPVENLRDVFKLAGEAIVKLVDLGYSNGKWYDASQVWDNTSVLALHLAAIVEVARVISTIRGRTLTVYSNFFEILPYLMIPGLDVKNAVKAIGASDAGAGAVVAMIKALYDPEFKKQVDKAVRAAKAKRAETYEPTECIHPECHNLVAPPGIKPREGHYKNYRGTGACRKGHNAYHCTKCGQPHSFVSKIGQAHYPKFYGEDGG